MTTQQLDDRIAQKKKENEKEDKRRSESVCNDRTSRQWGREAKRVRDAELSSLEEARELVGKV